MAQVPEPQFPKNTPQTGAQPYSSPQVSEETFGGGIARAQQGFGRQLEQTGDTLARHALAMQSDLNEAANDEAVTKFLIAQGELVNGFNQLQGKDRMNALPKFQTDLEMLRKSIRDELGNPMVRKMFDRQTVRQFGYTVMNASQGAASEMRKYTTGAAQARLAATEATAARNWQDDQRFEESVLEARQTAITAADVKGQAPEVQALAQVQAESRMWSSRLSAMADTDAHRARALFDKNKGRLTADAIGPLEHRINQNLIRQGVSRDAEMIAAGRGGFESILVKRESGGMPNVINRPDSKGRSFAGLYQFGAERLHDLGVYSTKAGWGGKFNIPGFPEVETIDDFLNNKEAQRATFQLHKAKMDQEIKENGLDKYIGQDIGQGVKLTQEGLYAAIHLAGVGGAERWLEGRGDPQDRNGTKVSDYARMGSRANAISPASNRNDLGVWLEEAKGLAARAPIPDEIRQQYEDQLTNAVRARYNTVKAIDREARQDAMATASTWALSGTSLLEMPKSIDEMPAEVKEAYDKLDWRSQKSITDQLARNAKADYPRTEESTRKFNEVLGMMTGTDVKDRQKAAAMDITSLEIPRADRQKLLDRQRKMNQASEADLHLNQILGYANVKAALEEARVAKNNRQMNAFKGALLQQLELTAMETKGKRLNEVEAGKLVSQMLREVSSGTTFFGLKNVTERLFRAEVPDSYRQAFEAKLKARGTPMDEDLLRRFYIRDQIKANSEKGL